MQMVQAHCGSLFLDPAQLAKVTACIAACAQFCKGCVTSTHDRNFGTVCFAPNFLCAWHLPSGSCSGVAVTSLNKDVQVAVPLV